MVLSEARRHAVLIDIMFPKLQIFCIFFTICLQVYCLPAWRIFSYQAFGTQVNQGHDRQTKGPTQYFGVVGLELLDACLATILCIKSVSFCKTGGSGEGVQALHWKVCGWEVTPGQTPISKNAISGSK